MEGKNLQLRYLHIHSSQLIAAMYVFIYRTRINVNRMNNGIN